MAQEMEPPVDQAYDLMRELNLLEPERIRIYFDEFGDLALAIKGGEVHKPVTPLRVFPITSEERFIALRDGDDTEIGIVRNIADLDAESGKALREEMKRAYFTPQIQMVNDIQERNHIPRWDVETDRGPRVFEIRSPRDVRLLGGGRILIRDADGNRYEIPDYRQLEPISRSMVESQI